MENVKCVIIIDLQRVCEKPVFYCILSLTVNKELLQILWNTDLKKHGAKGTFYNVWNKIWTQSLLKKVPCVFTPA